MWIVWKTDYHTYTRVMITKTDDVWMNGYRIQMTIYMLLRCVSETNREWYIKSHMKRCKVCTGDMDSTWNTDIMCSICCTCSRYESVMFMPTLWIWRALWTRKDAAWNYVMICMNMRITDNVEHDMWWLITCYTVNMI